MPDAANTSVPSLSPHASLRLAGQIAVITGGNRGIGFAVARALLSEGCSLVITGRDSQKLTRAVEVLNAEGSAAISAHTDQQVVPMVCDVRDAEAVERLFAHVKEQFGRLDILVNNAGISQSRKPIEETSIALWRDIIDVNLTGTFLCTRFGVPLMRRGGTILNVLSVAAREHFPGYTPYNSAKAGALGFTLTVREELMARGIRVTALLPGGTNTDIWEQVNPDVPREKLIEVESVARLVLEAVVLSPKANLTELVLDPVGGPF
jgi:NAD(P)-dependent dehydrogenase (short-subunit alcohol dehydrogenase family)